MPRVSAFRGTWSPNARPYVTLTPDVYVSIQGSTEVISCGECRRKVDFNRFVTGISTDANVEVAPGSAQIQLSIPDNSVNDFYVDGQLVIRPMMEIEIFAKGYFTVGGYPQYYRIFWGLVSSIQKGWSNGVTTVSVQCRDILRWWELTNVTLNPAFLANEGSSSGNYQLFQNQFAGANPYTVITALAREAMGDFSATTGSFTSFKPEVGKEQEVIGSFMKDVMAYWQLKFSNIWNNLVLYGSTGQAYTFSGDQGQVSAVQISKTIFAEEAATADLNGETSLFKIQPSEIAAFKVDVSRAGDVEFFQNETQSKLSVAMIARDQAGYEFYCDTTGDIIFKPPFYNLNVLPNKPVSWIQDFDIIEDSIHDSEGEVYTHITSSGNAFGGVTDWGLNDEITTPRTGVIDYHLLRNYGWRRLDYQCEWAGNPRKLFYHLLDYLDRVNAKRQGGTVTIPMRPELRMGFPVWIPRYDSFFYVQGISHQYSPGGQATSTLTLIAKRSKFIAPKNIGKVVKTGEKTVEYKNKRDPTKNRVRVEPTFQIDFPSGVGETSGVPSQQTNDYGEPAQIRDPRTGKLLGFPNAVMVFRQTYDGEVLARVMEGKGSTLGRRPGKQNKESAEGSAYNYQSAVAKTFADLQNSNRSNLIQRLRAHRYESGMTNAGLYDYAHDVDRQFSEFSVIPTTSILWGQGTKDPNDTQGAVTGDKKVIEAKKAEDLKAAKAVLREKNLAFQKAKANHLKATTLFNNYLRTKYKGKKPAGNALDEADKSQRSASDATKAALEAAKESVAEAQKTVDEVSTNSGAIRNLSVLNTMVRPVSDDFGFEVIGHHRYGRNAFIDRGKVQVNDPRTNSTANQINVQFAASGGLLTDNPRIRNDGLAPQSRDFAAAFEQMQPDDYVTGASFTGGIYDGDVDTSSINPTSQATYTSAANSNLSNPNIGKVIYAEADAVRRAKTLAELKPTIPGGLDEAIDASCPCMLGRTDWTSVLPQSFIEQIMSPTSSVRTSTVPTVDPETGLVTGESTVTETILTSQGSPVSGFLDGEFSSESNSFFNVLNNYLRQLFVADYADNKGREEFATTGGKEVFRDDPIGIDGSLTFPLPRDPLFNQAALGDPAALDALARDVNFNFDRSQKAADDFLNSSLGEQLTDSLADLPGSLFLGGLAVNVPVATGGLYKVGANGELVPTTTVQVQPALSQIPPQPSTERRSSQRQGLTGFSSKGKFGEDG
jgi:hypothetical protein